MYVYKNFIIIEGAKITPLIHQILMKYNFPWNKSIDPSIYSSEKDLIILSFKTNLPSSHGLNLEYLQNGQYTLTSCIKLLYVKIHFTFKVTEFNIKLPGHIREIMTTLKHMLVDFYNNQKIIWDTSIDSFIIKEAYNNGLIFNFYQHEKILKKYYILPKNTQPQNTQSENPQSEIKFQKKFSPVIQKKVVSFSKPKYLTWNRLIYFE